MSSKTIQMKKTTLIGGQKVTENGYPITTPDRVIDENGHSVVDNLAGKQAVISDLDEIRANAAAGAGAASDLSNYSLITETGNKIDVTFDSSTYKFSVKLFDKNNNLLSTSTEIDLPIESLVVSVAYDAANKKLVITLKNGSTVDVPIGDIITGLATETYVNGKVATKQDTISDLSTIRDNAAAGKGAADNMITYGGKVYYYVATYAHATKGDQKWYGTVDAATGSDRAVLRLINESKDTPLEFPVPTTAEVNAKQNTITSTNKLDGNYVQVGVKTVYEWITLIVEKLTDSQGNYYNLSEIAGRISTIEGKEAGWDAKLDSVLMLTHGSSAISYQTAKAAYDAGKLVMCKKNGVIYQNVIAITGYLFFYYIDMTTNIKLYYVTYASDGAWDLSDYFVLATSAEVNAKQDIIDEEHPINAASVTYDEDRPVSQAISELEEAVDDLEQASATHITDAPSDGKQYARKNGAWEEVTGGGGGSAAPFTGLCLTAQQANSTVKLIKNGSPAWTGSYSTDGQNWTTYTPDSQSAAQTITLANVGDKVYFKGDITANFSSSVFLRFVMTGKIAASGNCNSMYKSEGFENLTALTYTYCFSRLFYICSALVTAPELPAITLSASCYENMFGSCQSLIKAPELPATTLTNSCYAGMFQNCTSLVVAPELPATTLHVNCYKEMFNGCTSLVTAPDLPATTLVVYCYNSMFGACSALTKAPELPATTLAQSCYSRMFNSCTSLVTAPDLPATTLADGCYEMMFYGCTNLNYIKLGYTGNFDTKFNTWITSISATGTIVYKGTDPTRSASALPAGWNVMNVKDNLTTIEPLSDNTLDVVAIAVLDADPTTKYNGWVYMVKEAE